MLIQTIDKICSV